MAEPDGSKLYVSFADSAALTRIISSAAIQTWRRRALAPQGKRAEGGAAPNKIARETRAILLPIFISNCFSSQPRVFSRVACAKAAVARTNSRAQMRDRPLASSYHVRQRCAPTRSQNATLRAEWGRSHRDTRKPVAAARTVRAPGDLARCKSRLTQQNTPLFACGDNCCEFQETDSGALLP